jgi:hypothetical protein
MPTKIMYDVPQKRQMVHEAQKYYYIRYATGALRVVGWTVLVLGIIGSLVWGIGAGGWRGGLIIVIGIIGSFLAWLAFIAVREVLILLMDVKQNTLSTAGHITKRSS